MGHRQVLTTHLRVQKDGVREKHRKKMEESKRKRESEREKTHKEREKQRQHPILWR